MASTLIHGAWYLPERRELDLLLVGGRRYRYTDVPPDVARGFVSAPSKGSYYNAWIRNRFPCRALGQPPRRQVG
ncbi:MAG: KTSC domain-containing protein [Sphingomicrobium sp.]